MKVIIEVTGGVISGVYAEGVEPDENICVEIQDYDVGEKSMMIPEEITDTDFQFLEEYRGPLSVT